MTDNEKKELLRLALSSAYPGQDKSCNTSKFDVCMIPTCKSRANLNDWMGYDYCIKHWYSSFVSGENSMWFYIKTTKIK